MLTVLLDTSFLIDFLRGSASAEKKLRYYTESYEPLTTTPINAAELFKGAYLAKGRKAEVAKAKGMLEHLELLDLSVAVCEKYGSLISELRSKGPPIGDLDTLIASAAIVHRQILLSRNKAHFERVPGLALDSW